MLGGQAVTQNATPNTTNTNTLSFQNNVSLAVAQQAKTANVEVTGQNSDGQAITAIQKSITVGTSVGAVGGDSAPGLVGLQNTSGYIAAQYSSLQRKRRHCINSLGIQGIILHNSLYRH